MGDQGVQVQDARRVRALPREHEHPREGREDRDPQLPGEKRTRTCNMLEGVKITRDEMVKDCLVLEGNDIDNVSKSAALIHMACLVKKKDIRKFLDGFYVSEKGVINDE